MSLIDADFALLEQVARDLNNVANDVDQESRNLRNTQTATASAWQSSSYHLYENSVNRTVQRIQTTSQRIREVSTALRNLSTELRRADNEAKRLAALNNR
ncbi:MAG: WXG100 family type VII secretion target [Firmicutes bacterium]|nr:WXG100 family type VII secretion target [Bacillota bacterium]